MKLKFLLIYSLIVLSDCISAQKIDVTLPQNANKEYVFVLNKGIIQDTIQQGKFGFAGNTTIVIPEKDSGYVGMGSLRFKNGAPLNMILNHESFSVSLDKEGQYVFKNSIENKYLYSFIQNESKPILDTTLYADSFLKLLTYLQQANSILEGRGTLADKMKIEAHGVNQLDMEALYTSSIWYNVVDVLIRMPRNEADFSKNMITLLKRIGSDTVFEHLSDNLITIMGQYGWEEAFDTIVPYIEESGRIPVPQGQIYTAFALARVRKGTVAPPLEGISDNKGAGVKKILLVFYQPDCQNCEEQLEILIKDYEKLKNEGIRIILISSDHDRDRFAKDVANLPWADKLCDFKGFAGRNFLNYGILGTPTFFLLDNNWVVNGRYAKVSEIFIKQN